MECSLSNPDYKLLLALDVPLIGLYQGIPLLYFILLFLKRDRLNPTVYGRDFKELPPAQEQDLKYSKREKDPKLADLKCTPVTLSHLPPPSPFLHPCPRFTPLLQHKTKPQPAVLFSVYQCPYWAFEVGEMYRRIVLLGFLPLISSLVNAICHHAFSIALSCITLRQERKKIHSQPNPLDTKGCSRPLWMFPGVLVNHFVPRDLPFPP